MDQIFMTTMVVTSTTKICTQFHYIAPLKLFNKKIFNSVLLPILANLIECN